jgi:hypothetical protein
MFKASSGGMSSTGIDRGRGGEEKASSASSSNRVHLGPYPYVSSLFEIVKGFKVEGRIIIESDYIYEKEFGGPNVKVEYMLPSDLKHVYDISIIRKYTLNEYSKAFRALWTILKDGLPEDQLLELLTTILKDLKPSTLEELVKRLQQQLKTQQASRQEQSAQKKLVAVGQSPP